MADTETAVVTLEPTKPVHRLTQEDRMKGVKARLEKAAAKKALASSQTLVLAENNGDTIMELDSKSKAAKHLNTLLNEERIEADKLRKLIESGKGLYGWGSKPATDRPEINIASLQILSQLKRKD